MPSPFPGMNPWLETPDVWSDLHQTLLVEFRRQLAPQIGADLFLKLDVKLVLRERSAKERGFVARGDLGAVDDAGRPFPDVTAKAVESLPAPVTLTLPAAEEEVHRRLEIRDLESRAVVTVLELLSPSNKRGDDREAYLAKRMPLLYGGRVQFVEIDLLRGGRRMALPDAPPSDYYALARRWQDHPRVGFWPIMLRDPLPRVPVPLREAGSVAWLDLKAALDAAYDEAGYAKWVYQRPPEPPLSAADAAWAAEVLLAARGRVGEP